MCPNFIQRAVAAVDLVSAQLAKNNTSCVRQPHEAFRVVRDTLLDATITIHLEHAHAAVVAGDREDFGRRCEYAVRLARRQAPGRIDDVERVVAAGPRSVR